MVIGLEFASQKVDAFTQLYCLLLLTQFYRNITIQKKYRSISLSNFCISLVFIRKFGFYTGNNTQSYTICVNCDIWGATDYHSIPMCSSCPKRPNSCVKLLPITECFSLLVCRYYYYTTLFKKLRFYLSPGHFQYYRLLKSYELRIIDIVTTDFIINYVIMTEE